MVGAKAMRIVLAITGLLCATLAQAASADEIPATSRVDSVIIFPSGAEVTRAARLNLDKGEHAVIFSDLPAEAIPGSIRVEGNATAKLSIQSVDSRRRYIARADQASLQAERKRIEDEIERLRDARGLAQGEQDAAQTQKTLLTNLAELPGRAPEGQAQTPVPQTDWQQLLSLIATGMTQAQKNALDAEVKKRDLDRQIEDLEKKLSALAPARIEQTEVKVFVNADAPLEADLTVRYQVRNAAWVPRYDARLDTGSKTEAPRLTLTRRAEIKQRTGEAWDNVAVQLSTTRPTVDASAPELKSVTVDFEPEPRPVAATAPPPPAPAAKLYGLAAPRHARVRAAGAQEAADAVAPAPLEIAEEVSSVEAAPFQAVFNVPARLSIPANGDPKRVLLQEDFIEPGLTIRTVPKVDPRAYLYAKLTLPKGSSLLPGSVSLFRDGTFVGTGKLPVLAQGETYELGFGTDDQVRVRHSIVNEKRGETGLISSARTDSRSYRITVKNMHERAVDLVVHDQIPVSENQDIKVELTGPTPPTRQDIDDKRGVLSFESKIDPEEERVIEFGYRVVWPGARPVVYR
jgi:uncharacterized protein (TIGR02231 family)